MTNAVTLSTESFIKVLGNSAKRFNCRSTQNLESTKEHILLTALYFSDVCVFRGEGERERLPGFGHLPFSIACSHEL
jgi:hypothetical protein